MVSSWKRWRHRNASAQPAAAAARADLVSYNKILLRGNSCAHTADTRPMTTRPESVPPARGISVPRRGLPALIMPSALAQALQLQLHITTGVAVLKPCVIAMERTVSLRRRSCPRGGQRRKHVRRRGSLQGRLPGPGDTGRCDGMRLHTRVRDLAGLGVDLREPFVVAQR